MNRIQKKKKTPSKQAKESRPCQFSSWKRTAGKEKKREGEGHESKQNSAENRHRAPETRCVFLWVRREIRKATAIPLSHVANSKQHLLSKVDRGRITRQILLKKKAPCGCGARKRRDQINKKKGGRKRKSERPAPEKARGRGPR